MDTDEVVLSIRRSDRVLFLFWTYVVYPLITISFFWSQSRDGRIDIEIENLLVPALAMGLVFGLHIKAVWAWMLNWVGMVFVTFLAGQIVSAAVGVGSFLAATGAVGGIIAFGWFYWNFTAWRRLRSVFGGR